jgi:hypothetical protein
VSLALDRSLTFVISWSTSSRASASGYVGVEFNGLAALARDFSQEPTVRALIDAKGASCSNLPQQLSGWWQTGRLHCVHGPNRMAHWLELGNEPQSSWA